MVYDSFLRLGWFTVYIVLLLLRPGCEFLCELMGYWVCVVLILGEIEGGLCGCNFHFSPN